LVADALLRYLVAALATADPERGRGAQAVRRAVAVAQAYVREHYRQPLTAAEVAAAAGVSASHLHRGFRAETGTTLVAYVHGLRLAAAAELLRDTDETVLAVAHEVGFASQSHLTRLFTRQFGCPPGRYRTRARARGVE
ncbi:MAG: helix-turn-helix transcriptional regulator, partial [Thermomicrobiales bacterium]|nr:helix-turn-helix transcriptional regulator [Thermomicrobiales bacterium]